MDVDEMLDMYDQLINISAEFNKFVKLQEGKSTEQIAEEYGIDLKAIRENGIV